MLPDNNSEGIVKRLKKSFGVKCFKHLNFNIWLLGTFIGFFGYFIPIVNIDHHSIKTFPDKEPVIVNVVFSTAAGVAALIFGKLGDYTRFNPVHYHTGVWFVYGVVQMSIPFATNFYIFLVQLIILGALDGIWLSFKVPIACHLVGSSALANQASGYFHTAMAPLTVAGPAVAGWLYERYHNYDLAFYLGGTASLICCSILVVGILVPDLFRYAIKRKNNKIANEHFKKNVNLEEINYY
jgi:MFS family permease